MKDMDKIGLGAIQKRVLEAVLRHVGQPQRTPSGWTIGVVSREAVGDRNTLAPKGTLEAFFNYLDSVGEEHKITNWWGLPPELKQLLDEKRRGGQFGGLGPGKAPYMWIQNHGNAKAGIRGNVCNRI